MPTYKELLERQMIEFPQTRVMTFAQVMEWAHEHDDKPDTFRYRHICSAGYYDQVVWYTLDEYTHDGKPRPWGFRYGLEGSEYVSGFCDC